jgi:hypothetical protein
MSIFMNFTSCRAYTIIFQISFANTFVFFFHFIRDLISPAAIHIWFLQTQDSLKAFLNILIIFISTKH